MTRDQVIKEEVEELRCSAQEDFEIMDCEQEQTNAMQQGASEPQCCAICFTEPASPLNVGQTQQQHQDNKENLNQASCTTINHVSGFASLPCCGGAQGQCEATTSTKICTSCVLALCQQARKLDEAANSFNVNSVAEDQISILNFQTTPTGTATETDTAMVTPTTPQQESCSIHCPRCRHRVSVQTEKDGVYITSSAPKVQSSFQVRCPTPMRYVLDDSEELIHVLNPYASRNLALGSPRFRQALEETPALELPRRGGGGPLAPLVAPRNGRRERPSIALRRQLFRSPLASLTFLRRQESNVSAASSILEEEDNRALVRTLSFWE